MSGNANCVCVDAGCTDDLYRNQNTATYGRTANGGCWYNKDGALAAGSYGTNAGKFSWAKGIMGTLKKAEGK